MKKQTKKYDYNYIGAQVDSKTHQDFIEACNTYTITSTLLIRRAVQLYISDADFRNLIHGNTFKNV